MKDVVVLMSTYNGKKYLKEQIDSIIYQNYSDSIMILIRDDGSTDETIDIIQSYSLPRNRSIKLVKGSNKGPQKSFLELIKISESAKYYFYSDQDDIWYNDKIKDAVEVMEKVSSPMCYCTNYDIYNSDLNIKRNEVIKETPEFTPIKSLLYNQIPGCAMGFNYQLMQILKKLQLENVMMHDSMTLSLAAATGVTFYNKKSSILHRIHGNNVVGEGHKKIIPHKWIIEKIKLVVRRDDYDISEMADQFIQNANIKSEYLRDICLLRDYKKNWRNTIKLLRHPDSHDVQFDRTTLSIRSKILLHVF